MRKQIPFYKQIPLYALKIKKMLSKTPALKPRTILISSPKLLTKFAPVSPMIKHSSRFAGKSQLKTSSVLAKLASNTGDIKKVEETKVKPSKGMLARHVPLIEPTKDTVAPSPNINTEAIRLPNTIKTNILAPTKAPDTAELLKSPSLFLRGTGKSETAGMIYCECGNPCEGDSTLCDSCLKSKESVEYSGYLYLKDKVNQLKRYWYILLNKELYCN
jgi:hypothetical protein